MPDPGSALLIYTTFETADAARTLGRALVETRLAACCNIIDGMTSIYEWEGRLEESPEVVMIVKTSEACLDAALDHLKRLHPYETPALIVLNPQKVDSDFAAWIAAQTGNV